MVTAPTVFLRSFQGADMSFFADMARDVRVTHFIGDGQPWQDEMIDTRVRAALELMPLDQPGAVRWFTAEVSNTPVGLVVSTRNDDGIEIGYWVASDHWGKGIAGAMVDQAIVSIPELFGVSDLTARVDQGNLASARILSRRGFTLSMQESGLDHYKLHT